jgi:alpha-glucoside transport system permease protein
VTGTSTQGDGVVATPRQSTGQLVLNVARSILVPLVALVILAWGFQYLREASGSRIIIVLVALVVGVGGVFALFWGMNEIVDRLPASFRESVRPYVFVGPAVAILGLFLVYPVINTLFTSLQNSTSTGFVGLDNFRFVFTDPSMLRAVRNTLGWIIIVPLFGTLIGLVFATLADRLRRGEAFAKSMLFLPMAISFAGAAITWRLVYSFRPAGFGSNIGLFNGVMLGLGQEPVAWLDVQPWNNLMLMVIMIWMQTGFALVVLSAAIKSVPDDIIEAARIDGASEWQVFRRIIVPSILPTIVVVATYMVINALKVFDIVFIVGSAETRGTEVIAERMIAWFFIRANAGRGAAIAVVLFIAVIPVMIWNVKRFREQESIR